MDQVITENIPRSKHVGEYLTPKKISLVRLVLSIIPTKKQNKKKHQPTAGFDPGVFPKAHLPCPQPPPWHRSAWLQCPSFGLKPRLAWRQPIFWGNLKISGSDEAVNYQTWGVLVVQWGYTTGNAKSLCNLSINFWWESLNPNACALGEPIAQLLACDQVVSGNSIDGELLFQAADQCVHRGDLLLVLKRGKGAPGPVVRQVAPLLGDAWAPQSLGTQW